MATTTLLFVIGVAARVCLAIVFVMASIGKLQHLAVLEGVVGNYRLLPRRLVRPVAMALPWVELCVGAALLSPAEPALPSIAAIALLLVFAWAMAVNLKRGRNDIDCGCHRPELRQTLQWPLVGRNLVLAAWLVVGLSSEAATDPVLLVVGAAGGVAGYMIYALFNAIASLSAFNRSMA